MTLNGRSSTIDGVVSRRAPTVDVLYFQRHPRQVRGRGRGRGRGERGTGAVWVQGGPYAWEASSYLSSVRDRDDVTARREHESFCNHSERRWELIYDNLDNQDGGLELTGSFFLFILFTSAHRLCSLAHVRSSLDDGDGSQRLDVLARLHPFLGRQHVAQLVAARRWQVAAPRAPRLRLGLATKNTVPKGCRGVRK